MQAKVAAKIVIGEGEKAPGEAMVGGALRILGQAMGRKTLTLMADEHPIFEEISKAQKEAVMRAFERMAEHAKKESEELGAPEADVVIEMARTLLRISEYYELEEEGLGATVTGRERRFRGFFGFSEDYKKSKMRAAKFFAEFLSNRVLGKDEREAYMQVLRAGYRGMSFEERRKRENYDAETLALLESAFEKMSKHSLLYYEFMRVIGNYSDFYARSDREGAICDYLADLKNDLQGILSDVATLVGRKGDDF